MWGSKLSKGPAGVGWAVYLALLACVVVPSTLCSQVAYIGDGAAARHGHGQATNLLAALNDSSVTEIVVLGVERLEDVDAQPVQLNRSVMIRGGAGLEGSVVNFNFMRNKVVFTAGKDPVIVTFRDLTMNNSRKASSTGIDLFGGTQMSTNVSAEMLLENIIRLRLACTDLPTTLSAISSYPRPPSKPGFQLIYPANNTCLNNTCYADGVHFADYAATVQPTDSDDELYLGPYIIHQRNVTRFCQHYVTDACIQQHGSIDNCVASTVEAAMAGQAGPQKSVGSLEPGAIAGVVIGGFAAVALVSGFAFWCYHKRHRGVEDDKADYPQDVETGLRADSEGGSSSAEKMEYMPFTRPMLSSAAGHGSVKRWQVVAEYSSESPERAKLDKQLTLGVLLGAGSFGRVYRGRWYGQDVAVKVMQHSTASAAPVMNEVHLMLSFTHPNVVRGFHFVSWAAGDMRLEPKRVVDKLPVDSASSMPERASSLQQQQQQQQILAQQQVIPYVKPLGSLQRSDSRGENRKPASPSTLQPPSPYTLSHPNSGPNSGKSCLGRNSGEQHSSSVSWQLQTMLQVPPFPGPGSQLKPPLGITTYSGEDPGVQMLLEAGAHVSYQPMPTSSSSGFRSGRDFSGIQGSHNDQEMESWLIQEYCDLGTLSDAVQQWQAEGRKQFMERLLVRLREVATGMCYLHSRSVLHGDLKGTNILLSTCPTNPFSQIAKISDFGISRALDGGRSYRRTHTLGTVTHMPPEQLRQGKMSPAGDVYAFGILMWELLTGSPAFAGRHVAEVIQTVALEGKRPPIPQDAPEDYSLLMRSCWAADAADRPSFESILTCLNLMLQDCDAEAVSAREGLASHELVADL